MTKTTLKPGDTIHFLGAMTVGIAAGSGRAVQRGTQLEITNAIIEQAKDRNGNSWLDLVDDEAAQVERWGRAMFARGEVPESVQWWDTGNDADRTLARNLELEAAAKFTVPAERKAEEKRIFEKYGTASTSRSLTYSGE